MSLSKTEKMAEENKWDSNFIRVIKVSDQRKKYNFIGIDLEVNRVTIYGCTFREGKDGWFVSFPSRKGSDGKWYKYVFVNLSAADIENIENQVESML